jgi:hypothetical protein
MAADSVGLKPELMPEELDEFSESSCRSLAAEWLKTWKKDRDVLSDMRVMVPVNRDENAGKAIYWATLGVRGIRARAEFVNGFEPRDISGCWTGKIVPHDYYLMVEASAEVRLPLEAAPPTREELRKICDKYDNIADMVAALENQRP